MAEPLLPPCVRLQASRPADTRCWPRATVPGAGRGEGAQRSRHRSVAGKPLRPRARPLQSAAGLGRCGRAARPVFDPGGCGGPTPSQHSTSSRPGLASGTRVAHSSPRGRSGRPVRLMFKQTGPDTLPLRMFRVPHLETVLMTAAVWTVHARNVSPVVLLRGSHKDGWCAREPRRGAGN